MRVFIHSELAPMTAALIRRFCHDLSNRCETENLINLAALIACQGLFGKLRAAAHFQGISPKELALSLLGEIFSESEGQKSLRKHLLQYINEDDYTLFRRFKAIILRTISQGLFHRWKENDPTGARLWKNFHCALKITSAIYLFPEDRPKFISASRDTGSNRDLVLLGQDELIRITTNVIRPEMSMPEIIMNILQCIGDKYRDTPWAVPIDQLFSAISEVRLRLSAELSAYSSIAEKQDADFDIIVQNARAATLKQIDILLAHYMKSGKFTSDKEDKLRLALEEILDDCMDGGPALFYSDYLRLNWPDLAAGEYQQDFRTRFEYLAKNIQDHFYDFIRKYL